MQVSHQFYSMAGPMLYREIIIHETNLDNLARGSGIVTRRATRAHPFVLNLKTDLLKHIKVLEVSAHDEKCVSNGALGLFKHIQRVDVIRFVFPLSSTHLCGSCYCPVKFCALAHDDEEEHMSFLYDLFGPEEDDDLNDFHQLYDCTFLAGIEARKIVLTSLVDCAVMDRIYTVIWAASTLTIILSPDDLSISSGSGAMVNYHATMASRKASGIQLRLIIAPWSKRIANLGGDSGRWPSWKERFPADADQLADFLGEVISNNYRTTVYLIEGRYRDARKSLITRYSEGRRLPPTSKIENALRVHLGPDSDLGAQIVFKTRSDYLAEGVTDEIDSEELKRWIKVDAKERVSEKIKEFGKTIVAEQMAWRRAMEDEGTEYIDTDNDLDWSGSTIAENGNE